MSRAYLDLEKLTSGLAVNHAVQTASLSDGLTYGQVPGTSCG